MSYKSDMFEMKKKKKKKKKWKKNEKKKKKINLRTVSISLW